MVKHYGFCSFQTLFEFFPRMLEPAFYERPLIRDSGYASTGVERSLDIRPKLQEGPKSYQGQ